MSEPTTWWRLVAAREVTTRVRDKTFLISTAVLVALVFGGIIIGSVVGGRPASYDVAVTDQAGTRLVALTQDQLRAQSGDDEAEVTATEVDDNADARAAVDDEDVDAALLPTRNGFDIVGRDEVPSDLLRRPRAQSRCWFLVFLVVGFLALASLWSVAGSLATRQEDLQATTVPGQALLIVPYLIAVTERSRLRRLYRSRLP